MGHSGEIILLSSTSGLDIKDCAQRLCDFEQAPKPYGPITLESFHADDAKEYLDKRGIKRAESYNYVDVLGLPLGDLAAVCKKSWDRMFELAHTRADASSKYIVSTFHPVLYHQLTREFAEPYLAGNVIEVTKEHAANYGVKIKWIVSIHDDIYDVYRNLMQPGKLFSPRRRKARNPLEDITDLRLLLDWRDRELSTARALAASIGARHLLFHKKGRVNSLQQILFNDRPCVYLSHPISQPRRDILNKPDPEKCKKPDAQRGYQMIQAVQSFADHLALFIPIVEPTAIDEFRINTDNLAKLREQDLSTAIMPPLTVRWPIGEGLRLGGDPSDLNHENNAELLAPFNGTLAALQRLQVEDKHLKWLKSSLELLLQEIKRQINVRDRVLASQADIIVALRPYSLPDSSDPTGGVDAEIETIKKKSGPRDYKPHLIIIHPKKDELQRRGNEFDKIWDAELGKHYDGSNEDLAHFKAECRRLLTGPKTPQTSSEFRELLTEIFKDPELSARPKVRESSMPKGSLMQDADARRSFIEALSSSGSIVRAPLEVAADQSEGSILLVKVSEFCDDLMKIITGIQKIAQPIETS